MVVSLSITTGCKKSFVRQVDKVSYQPNYKLQNIVFTNFVYSVDPEFDNSNPPEVEYGSTSFFDDSDDSGFFDDVGNELFEPSRDIQRALNVLEVVKRSAKVYQEIDKTRQEVESEIELSDADVISVEHLESVNPHKDLLVKRHETSFKLLSQRLAKKLKINVAPVESARSFALYNNLGYPQSDIKALVLPTSQDGFLSMDVVVDVDDAQINRDSKKVITQSDLFLTLTVHLYDNQKQIHWADTITYKSDIPLKRTFAKNSSTGELTLVREDKPELEQLLEVAFQRLTHSF